MFRASDSPVSSPQKRLLLSEMRHSMKRKMMMWIPVIMLASATADAQIVADLVAAPQIPAGSVFAPHTPAGVAIVGTNIWVGDAAQGFRHYVPVDPNNTDPINMGQLKFDLDPNFSMG